MIFFKNGKLREAELEAVPHELWHVWVRFQVKLIIATDVTRIKN